MKRFAPKLLFILLAGIMAFCLFAAAGSETVDDPHTDITIVVSPSCFTPGSAICNVCGDKVTIPAFGYHIGVTKVKYETISEPTCTALGSRYVITYCDHCKGEISRTTESIPMVAHTWPGSWTVVTEATCTADGLQVKNCTVCGTRLDSAVIPAHGHNYGSWITVEATCTTSGYEYRECSYDASHRETRNETPALGHDWGEYKVTTPATCTSEGVETSTCSRCGTTRTRAIPAIGHKWDSGVVTVEPGCTTAGLKVFTCQNDPSHTYTETIAALGHKWTKWDVDRQPTCTEKGHRWHKCSVCGRTYDESMPALGHEWGPWELVKEPSAAAPGLEQRVCGRCKAVKTREVPFTGAAARGGATMCVFGPRIKDVGTYLTPGGTMWYMFTPIDASVEGAQTYELVVDDSYICGTATVTVAGGTVSLAYELYTESVSVDLEFFTFLPDMHVLNQYEPEALDPICGMEPGVAYSIADRFNGDTNLVLYFCSRVTYSYDPAGMSPLNYMSTYHQALLGNMLLIMD